MRLLKRLLNTKKGGPPRPYTGAVIVAAGASRRMEGTDKLLVSLGGIPVVLHSIRAFETNPFIDEIVVVTRPDLIVEIGGLCRSHSIEKVKSVIRGGDKRSQSVFRGIMELSDRAEYIAVHDGARPLVSEKVISNTVKAAYIYGCAIPAVSASDTIKTAENGKIMGTPERKKLYAAQTPQVFKSELIKAGLTRAQEEDIELTDDSMAVELLGAYIRIVEGSPENIKLTYPTDIITAEAILEKRFASEFGMGGGLL
ncbi:MAG: 2-C-methyl-D-erythritol 4-phosphate cytidylyltransferase [Clostridiales bacterium]|jgi:2-C-methyl-D-erythritol 4-phosphate cytidylyltransferase|nr:2-C-methyl-D-erythritol 4-phosphate cytidylyltransferase [Clostridiales bacterium]